MLKMRVLSTLMCWKGQKHLPSLHQAIMDDRVRESHVRRAKRLEKVDYKGRTILHIAAMTGHQGAIDAIVEEADRRRQLHKIINIMDKDGNTPLHLASQHGCKICIRLLYNAGCDNSIRNKRGELPARDVDDNDEQSSAHAQYGLSDKISAEAKCHENGSPVALEDDHCKDKVLEQAVANDACSSHASVRSHQVKCDDDDDLAHSDNIETSGGQGKEGTGMVAKQDEMPLYEEMKGAVGGEGASIVASEHGSACEKRAMRWSAIGVVILFALILMILTKLAC